MSMTDVDDTDTSDTDAGTEEGAAIGGMLGIGAQEPKQPLPLYDTPTPYMTSRGQKPASEWGKPDYILQGAQKYPGIAPGPWMPQLSDVRNLVKNDARFFVEHGARPSQRHAAEMVGHSEKWWNEFSKGRRAHAQEALDGYRLAQAKLTFQEKNMLTTYGDIWSAYSSDPAKLREKLLEASYQYDDSRLRDVLQSQGLQSTEQLLSRRHNSNLNQLKIIHQREQNAKLEGESKRNADVARSIAEITDPNAASDATRRYLDTGEGAPDALPSTDPAHFSSDPLAPKPIAPLQLPAMTPATSADQAHAVPPPFPAGVDATNAGQRRAELTDWANRIGLAVPPSDTAGLNNWLTTHRPSGPMVAQAAPPPSAALAETPTGTPTPSSPNVAERDRLAALAGYSGPQLDRLAWDYFIYGRVPHSGAIPKDLQSLWTKQNEVVKQRVLGRGGIEEWIESLTRAVGPAPLGISQKEAVARADAITDKITAIQPEIGNQLRWIIHGFVQMPPAGFGATAVGPQRFRGLVARIDPTYTNTRYETNRRTAQAFSGNGALGQRVVAFKTAINHASTMMRIIDQMPNTPITDLNHFLVNIRTRLGDPTATEFNTAFNLFSTEVARSFRGSQTTLSEIAHIRENLSVAASPAQMRAGMRAMAELMQGQLDALADQYNLGTLSNIKGADLFNDPRYIEQFNRLLALPFPASTAGLKPPETYRHGGNVIYSSDLPNEAASLNAWLTANPTNPKAAALREKLRSLGWLSRGNE